MRRWGILSLLAVSVAVASIVTAGPARADTVDPAAAAQQFYALTNGARAAAGVAALAWRGDVANMAVAHSAEMAQAGNIWHGSFVSEGNLTALNANLLAENVGMGSDVQTIHDAFMNSPHHRENILDAGLSQVGIGVVVGGDGTVYVTEDFLHPKNGAAPRPAATPATSRPAAAAAPHSSSTKPVAHRSTQVAAASAPTPTSAVPPATTPVPAPAPQGVVTAVPLDALPAAAVPALSAGVMSDALDGGTALWTAMFGVLLLVGAVSGHSLIRRRSF